jgi:hypothetical protein
MRFVHFLPYLMGGGLMILHGFAHLPGVLGSWDLATFEDVSRQPNLWLTNAGDGLLMVLGAIWLIAGVAFVVAGVGVLRKREWWPMVAALAIVVSVPMTILWRDDASIGLLLNAALLAILIGWMLLTSIKERQVVE